MESEEKEIHQSKMFYVIALSTVACADPERGGTEGPPP